MHSLINSKILFISIFNSIVLFLSFNYNIDKILLSTLIFTNFYLIYIFRDNTPLFIFSIFISFYSISLIPYYFFSFNISFFDSFNSIESYRKTLIVHSLFLFSFLFFVRPSLFQNSYFEYLKINAKSNKLLFYISYLICIFILIKGISGDNLFISGQYAGDSVVKSTFYEYFILFYLLSFYFSNKTVIQKYLLFIIYIAYCIKTLLFGGRIEVVQLTILLFLLVTVLTKKQLKNFQILLLLIFFYYFNIIISNIRNNPSLVINQDYISILNPLNFINSNKNVIYSNEGEVFQSSSRLIGLVDSGIISIKDRIVSFFTFIFSVFIPTNFLPPTANLMSYKQDEITSGGGGLISAYSYIWFGLSGPIIFAYILVKTFTNLQKTKSTNFKLYGYMILSTFPRWYSYNPLILIKLCFWIIPIVFFFNSFKHFIIIKEK